MTKLSPYPYVAAGAILACVTVVAGAVAFIDNHNEAVAAQGGPLPTAAANVVDLGNGWRTFDLKDGPTTRRFLIHYRLPTGGTSGTATETIVELKETAP